MTSAPMGKVPYRENDRPVGAAVPEGMEGTMSSPVILFNTTAVVVDLQKRQSPRGGPYPEVRKEPPSEPCPKTQPAVRISSSPLPHP